MNPHNTDKRRRARVQGGWATPSSATSRKSLPKKRQEEETSVKNGINSANSGKQEVFQESVPQETAKSYKERISSARSDRDKVKPTPMPVWVGKNIDQPAMTKPKFVFQEPEEEFKVKPKDLVITKPGVHDISTEPSGVSRLRYFPQFVDPSRCEAIFAELYSDVPWIQRHDVHQGVTAMQPRLTAWYGDQDYTYSGVTVKANTSEWPLALKQLRAQLTEVTGIEFNSLAANLYRDGHDSIGWHSDDEAIMGPTPIIASLSFGEERNFELRKKPPLPPSGERDYTYSQVVRVPLRPGALLIMEGHTQADWQHRVPKEYHDRGARINVTFRIVRPVDEW